MAVDEQEGPDASPFKGDVGSLYSGISLLYYRRPFAPACGIPWPVTFLEELAKAGSRPSRRLFVAFGDRHNLDLYLRIYELGCRQAVDTPAARRSLLHQVAAEQVGEGQAAKLVDVWSALQVAEQLHRSIRGGGTVFILGGVHQRWITRPLVPFPGRLTPAETAWWRPFQFQARGFAEADDLMDIQGFRVPDVNGGYDHVVSVLARIRQAVDQAEGLLEDLLPALSERPAASARLLGQRLAVFRCLVDNARHVVNYQRLLDGLADDAADPGQSSPVAERRAGLDRIADEEIANTQRLITLLESESAGPLLDHAGTDEREYQRLLGGDLGAQLRRKIEVMKAHLDNRPERSD